MSTRRVEGGAIMNLNGSAKMIRIHFGEDDCWHGKPLYEAIVEQARRQDLYRGIEGYGAAAAFIASAC